MKIKLSTDAKIVAGALFAFPSGSNGTELIFANRENRPTERTRKALNELIAADFVVREKPQRAGEERYRGLPQCSIFRKFAARAPEAKHFDICEPVTDMEK